MRIFRNLRASQAISTVLAAPSRGDAERGADKLRALGDAALPKLLEALPRDQSGTLVAVLGDLANNANLRLLVNEGLLSEDADRAAAVKRALHRASRIDLNRMLELYVAKGGAISAIVDLLAAHKATLNGKSVLRLLEQASADNQLALFRLIDQVASDTMVGPLIGFLKHAEWAGRVHIARTLARFPSDRVCEALLRLLEDKHKAVRTAALEALGPLAAPVPVAPMCALLRDADLTVQSKAVEALIARNDPRSVSHLLAILQDESEHARRAAVEVLNAVGDTNAINDLLFALKDKDWWVRARAADALGAIGGPRVIDAVLRLLAHQDHFLRRTAIEILNTNKDPRAFDHLVAALDDPDWWVRERAIDALANLGDARAVPHLVRLLGAEEKTAQASMRALRRVGDDRAIVPLVGKLAAEDDLTQREAIEALTALAVRTPSDGVAVALRNFVAPTTSGRDAAAELVRRLRAGPPSTSSGGAALGARAEQQASVVAADIMHPTLQLGGNGQQPVRAAAAISGNTMAASALDPRELQPGQVLADRYKILRTLGRGAFGQVLHVEDQLLKVDIALKILHRQVLEDETSVPRFIHEVRCARRISHESVIRIHDFLTLGPYYAISMEYFASEPLTVRLQNGLHREPALGLRIIRDIARAIEVAHEAGVIHRDVKPGNVLVNAQHVVKLVDFGVSMFTGQDATRLTRTGFGLGTPTYMSPEQVQGVAVDARTDIYSLGTIMYEVFTGTVPYTAEHALGLALKHLKGEKDAPRARNPNIPPALEAIILKAMTVDPAARHQSATELLAEMDAMFTKGEVA